jgi:hypothetical protein
MPTNAACGAPAAPRVAMTARPALTDEVDELLLIHSTTLQPVRRTQGTACGTRRIEKLATTGAIGQGEP